MRIIAGTARGRVIAAPKGQDTRPTQDYVRESLFNILQRDVPEARVLDLFAGSGALGLEALSRGAESATLVDCAAEAIDCIRRNADTLGMGESVTVLRGDWKAMVKRLAREGKRYSLVFLDPPYRMDNLGEQCACMADMGLLEDEATVVIEHRRDMPTMPDERFIHRDTRQYGDTVIQFYVFREGGIAGCGQAYAFTPEVLTR